MIMQIISNWLLQLAVIKIMSLNKSDLFFLKNAYQRNRSHLSDSDRIQERAWQFWDVEPPMRVNTNQKESYYLAHSLYCLWPMSICTFS